MCLNGNVCVIQIDGSMKVHLMKEPENKYDSQAVKVLNSAGQQVGHVEKNAAHRIFHILETSLCHTDV